MEKKKKLFLFLLISFITIIASAGIYYFSINHKNTISVSNDDSFVVAKVNGKEITRKEFNLAMNGMIKSLDFGRVDTSRPDVQDKIMVSALNMVIDRELLAQKAASLNLYVSQTEINSELDSIAKELGGRTEYLSSLSKNGISEDEIRKDIEKQLLISKYEFMIINPEKDVVSETEIKSYYEEIRNKYIEQGSIAPDLDLVRNEIYRKIIDRKHNEFLNEEAKKIRKEAKVDIYI